MNIKRDLAPKKKQAQHQPDADTGRSQGNHGAATSIVANESKMLSNNSENTLTPPLLWNIGRPRAGSYDRETQ